MHFHNILAHVAPRAEDAASLARKREALADQLDRHAWRERRVVAGSCGPETVDCVIRHKYLSRVLTGPRAVYGPRAT
jgi:hypothetical protein